MCIAYYKIFVTKLLCFAFAFCVCNALLVCKQKIPQYNTWYTCVYMYVVALTIPCNLTQPESY